MGAGPREAGDALPHGGGAIARRGPVREACGPAGPTGGGAVRRGVSRARRAGIAGRVLVRPFRPAHWRPCRLGPASRRSTRTDSATSVAAHPGQVRVGGRGETTPLDVSLLLEPLV